MFPSYLILSTFICESFSEKNITSIIQISNYCSSIYDQSFEDRVSLTEVPVFEERGVLRGSTGNKRFHKVRSCCRRTESKRVLEIAAESGVGAQNPGKQLELQSGDHIVHVVV